MKYAVELQSEETNELANNCSITGTVNGTQTACVLKCSLLTGLNEPEKKKVKQRELVAAFLSRRAKPTAAAEEVEYEPPA